LTSHKHAEVVSISHEVQTTTLQFPVEFVQDDIGQDRRKHASNDIANIGELLERLIVRKDLRPGYGEGWNPP
jgi:hypothetical protein